VEVWVGVVVGRVVVGRVQGVHGFHVVVGRCVDVVVGRCVDVVVGRSVDVVVGRVVTVASAALGKKSWT
jgi:hypothetical protein